MGQGSNDTQTEKGSRRILMADDDRTEHLMLLLAADKHGSALEISFVDDGSDLMMTLAQVEYFSDLPDLIILDLRMPKLDGHRTLDELQAHPVFWQIPVVMFTSSSRIEDKKLSVERGAVWFETKPSDFSGMTDFVDRVAARAVHAPYAPPEGYHLDHESPLVLLSDDLLADMEDRFIDFTPFG